MVLRSPEGCSAPLPHPTRSLHPPPPPAGQFIGPVFLSLLLAVVASGGSSAAGYSDAALMLLGERSHHRLCFLVVRCLPCRARPLPLPALPPARPAGGHAHRQHALPARHARGIPPALRPHPSHLPQAAVALPHRARRLQQRCARRRFGRGLVWWTLDACQLPRVLTLSSPLHLRHGRPPVQRGGRRCGDPPAAQRKLAGPRLSATSVRCVLPTRSSSRGARPS